MATHGRVSFLMMLVVIIASIICLTAAAPTPDFPKLSQDYVATYDLHAKGVPEGVTSKLWSSATNKKMRSDTTDAASKTTYSYYIYFDQPKGITTSYTTYGATVCQKEESQYEEGEEFTFTPGATKGCREPSFLGINRVNGKLTNLWELECPGGNFQLYFADQTLVRSIRSVPESHQGPLRSIVMDYTTFETRVPTEDVFQLPEACSEANLARQEAQRKEMEKNRPQGNVEDDELERREQYEQYEHEEL